MDLEYIREECDNIIKDYRDDREMAHIRADNFILEFLQELKKTITDEKIIVKIDLILEMNKATEDLKWYA